VRLITAPFNAIIDHWNGLHFHLPGVSVFGHAVIPDIDIGTPNLPRLATGGIVTRPTLALIGEAGPEAVVPLGRGVGAVNINMTVNGVIATDKRKFARELVDEIHGELLRKRQANGGYLFLPNT
jgi:hypothetical protein